MSLIRGYLLECDGCFMRSDFIGDGCGTSEGWTLVYRDGELVGAYCPYCTAPEKHAGEEDGE